MQDDGYMHWRHNMNTYFKVVPAQWWEDPFVDVKLIIADYLTFAYLRKYDAYKERSRYKSASNIWNKAKKEVMKHKFLLLSSFDHCIYVQ